MGGLLCSHTVYPVLFVLPVTLVYLEDCPLVLILFSGRFWCPDAFYVQLALACFVSLVIMLLTHLSKVVSGYAVTVL